VRLNEIISSHAAKGQAIAAGQRNRDLWIRFFKEYAQG